MVEQILELDTIHAALPLVDLATIRDDFPLLQQMINNRPLVYLDNAATTQKPASVIAATAQYYQKYNANIHRGLHTLSELATAKYEAARAYAARFLHAKHTHEIVFVRGVTEAVNLVAVALQRLGITSTDEIIVSAMEHHSNIVPWQLLCQYTGATLRVLPITATGDLDLAQLPQLLTSKTRLVAVNHVSNVLGTINDVKAIVKIAHVHGVPVLVDGAQAAGHIAVDVQDLDCDFYAISGHKAYGPTGIGVLYGKTQWLERLPPYQGGGEMIHTVDFAGTQFAAIPHKFEAGTPNIAGAIALETALRYITTVGKSAIVMHEQQLLHYVRQCLQALPAVNIIAQPKQQIGILAFTVLGAHAQDVGLLLDQHGIAVRTGHHCAMPLLKALGHDSVVRISLAMYNTMAEIDCFIIALQDVINRLCR